MKNIFKFVSLLGLTVLATGCAVYPSPQNYDNHIHSSNAYQGRTVQPVQVISNVQSPQVYVDANGNRYVSRDGTYAQVTPSPRQQYQQPSYQQYGQQQQYQQPSYQQYGRQQQYQQPSYQQYGQQQQYQQPSYQQYGQQQYQPQYRSTPSTGGALIGGAAGGLLGAQVGKGNGNLAATAIGAGTGSVVGAGCRTINGGQVIGAVVGGLLGSQVGKGHGRQAATAIGAGSGALVGNDMAGGCLR